MSVILIRKASHSMELVMQMNVSCGGKKIWTRNGESCIKLLKIELRRNELILNYYLGGLVTSFETMTIRPSTLGSNLHCSYSISSNDNLRVEVFLIIALDSVE